MEYSIKSVTIPLVVGVKIILFISSVAVASITSANWHLSSSAKVKTDASPSPPKGTIKPEHVGPNKFATLSRVSSGGITSGLPPPVYTKDRKMLMTIL